MKAVLKNRRETYREHIISPIDPILAAITLALLVFGSIMVGSASMEIGLRDYGNPFHLVATHHIYILLGLLSFVFVLGLPMIFWERMSWVFLIISLVLLIVVLMPGIGKEVNGSTRWIKIGPINLQGSEFVKLFFLVYLAKSLANKTDESSGKSRTFLVPIFFLGVIVLLLMRQPDFGASIVLIFASVSVLYLSGVSSRFLVPFGLLICIFITIFSLIQPYRFERIISFFDPWHDPFGSGYQLTQALIAFGRGEWLGLGLGNSIQKLFFLPEAHTDFIFSIIGEELGFVGAASVVLLFVVLVIRGLSIGNFARRKGMNFHSSLAYGISILLGVQSVVNLGVNLGVLPTKGITLPFISYGGNSLVVCLVMVAILLRIEIEARKGRERNG
ncbi:MAG: putative lipid II flippase FtsW [Gammaproteobacteria bacterium]|nr:putative lipid II flippase FtsW [Gammaproteobacteria bacterium]